MSAPGTAPGPWRVSTDDLGYHSIRTGERNDAPDSDLIADLFCSEQEVNLIAAAPDLYEALEAVDLARMTDAPSDWTRATELTDAALAKARGEAK